MSRDYQPYNPRTSSLNAFVSSHPNPIIVQHGPTRLAFPAGTPQAAIDKRINAIDKATKDARKLAKDPRPDLRLPKLTRVKVPSMDLLEGAGTVVPDHGYMDRHTARVVKYAAPGRPLVVMPHEALKAGLVAQAHRTLKKWPLENKPEHDAFMAKVTNGTLQKLPDAWLEQVVASILKPGGRVVSGKYAASLVWGLEELDRRMAASGQCEEVA